VVSSLHGKLAPADRAVGEASTPMGTDLVAPVVAALVRCPSHRRRGAPSKTALAKALRGTLFASLALLCACTTPTRLPAVPVELTTRATPAATNVRYWPDQDIQPLVDDAVAALARERKWRDQAGQTGPLPPVSYLAISGGGDDGAFAAGLLAGWSARGDRPEFKVVTGISTGALIAPFAFLGPDFDAKLREAYTNIDSKDIFRKRWLTAVLFNDAMADTQPMRRLIDRFVTPEMLRLIAAEYAKGRFLLVATTDLDARRPVIWNMTAIAASQDPHALDLFREVIAASAAIPGVFPPVMIDVQVDARRYQEMHVDGGTSAQVFLYPPALDLDSLSARHGGHRQRTLYVIRNARLDPDWASVDRRTLTIANRAVSSLIHSQGIGDLYRIYGTSADDGLEFNLAFIPSSFTTVRTKNFDRIYMRSLFGYAYDLALKGYPWEHAPPLSTSPRP
jgi:hypothetical protein